MTEVSSTRLYLGNLPRNATKADVEAHFQTHGTGEITEVKLMNGFGFIEYKDAMDARDVVPAFRMYPSRPLRVLFPRLTPSRWLRLHGRAPHCPVRSRFAPQRELHPQRACSTASSSHSVPDEDCKPSGGDQLAG